MARCIGEFTHCQRCEGITSVCCDCNRSLLGFFVGEDNTDTFDEKIAVLDELCLKAFECAFPMKTAFGSLRWESRRDYISAVRVCRQDLIDERERADSLAYISVTGPNPCPGC